MVSLTLIIVEGSFLPLCFLCHESLTFRLQENLWVVFEKMIPLGRSWRYLCFPFYMKFICTLGYTSEDSLGSAFPVLHSGLLLFWHNPTRTMFAVIWIQAQSLWLEATSKNIAGFGSWQETKRLLKGVQLTCLLNEDRLSWPIWGYSKFWCFIGFFYCTAAVAYSDGLTLSTSFAAGIRFWIRCWSAFCTVFKRFLHFAICFRMGALLNFVSFHNSLYFYFPLSMSRDSVIFCVRLFF